MGVEAGLAVEAALGEQQRVQEQAAVVPGPFKSKVVKVQISTVFNVQDGLWLVTGRNQRDVLDHLVIGQILCSLTERTRAWRSQRVLFQQFPVGAACVAAAFL